MSKPILWIVIPCYNEEQVLPITAPMFLQKITSLTEKGMISDKSRVLFVNDGSRDKTWELICGFAKQDAHFIGISQSRNRGHQNAVLAGLMEARANNCDITISIDCDGQDDINAMDEMVQKYLDGAEVVYGVRSRRDTDTFFKRFTAEGFYHLMNALGADIVFNHADYRLMSRRAAEKLLEFPERNLFIRGIVPLIGFTTDTVTYDRKARMAGESKYPLKKMLSFAVNGITSFSIRPIRLIFSVGIIMLLATIAVSLYTLLAYTAGHTIKGWTSLMLSLWFIGSLILISLGIIGEYIGKIYVEVKKRPRFFIEKSIINRTEKISK